MRKQAALLVLALASCSHGPPPRPSAPPPASVQRGIVYERTPTQQLRMDIYRPAGRGPFPAMVLIHPGGFVSGSRVSMADVAHRFASDGVLAAAIDYRLAPQAPFPAAVQDAQAAVQFLRGTATRWGIVASRIGLLGVSAGGTVALSAAETSDASSRVQVVASWSGITDFVSIPRSAPGPLTDIVNLYLGQEAPLPASPLTQLRAGAPPMFIANARVEIVPIGQARGFALKLTALGIPFKLWSTAHGHGLAYIDAVFPPTLEFIRSYL